MAAFTSVQSGNWNDGATWGNTSPGVKGTDWPGVAGDTFTIAAGHTVVYNVSEAAELGASMINGTLEFVTTAGTKLAFGNATLAVSSTGILRVGTEASPIPAAYTAEIVFNTTADNTHGLTIAVGGQYSICGDPSYCSSYSTTLAADAENTDGDTVITTVDDMSSIWHVGDEITLRIESMGDSSSYTDAVRNGVIQSISGTSITLDISITCQSGVGDTWISHVENLTRNVKIYKSGAVTDIASSSRYNTLRPHFVDNNTSGSNVCRYVQFTGFYRVTLLGGAAFSYCVNRNGEYALYGSTATVTFPIVYCCDYGTDSTSVQCVFDGGKVFAVRYAFYGEGHIVSAVVYAVSNVFLGTHCIMTGDIWCTYLIFASTAKHCSCTNSKFYSCYYITFSCIWITLKNCYVYDCYTAFTYSVNIVLINTVIGYDVALNEHFNTIDIREGSFICINCKFRSSGIVFIGRNTIGGYLHLKSGHHNQVLNAHTVISNVFSLVKTPCDGSGMSPSQDPDGGNADCIEINDLQSNICQACPATAFDDFSYFVNAAASVSKTYTFKLQSTFTSTLSASDISLEASYLAGSDGAQTVIASTGTVAPRSGASDWSQELSVTVTPAQAGLIFFQIKLSMYESGAKLYISPDVGIA